MCHVDGTARLQSLEPDGEPFIYAILESVEKRRGYPVVEARAKDRFRPTVRDAAATRLAGLQHVVQSER